jgi:hypothetical protein
MMMIPHPFASFLAINLAVAIPSSFPLAEQVRATLLNLFKKEQLGCPLTRTAQVEISALV